LRVELHPCAPPSIDNINEISNGAADRGRAPSPSEVGSSMVTGAPGETDAKKSGTVSRPDPTRQFQFPGSRARAIRQAQTCDTGLRHRTAKGKGATFCRVQRRRARGSPGSSTPAETSGEAGGRTALVDRPHRRWRAGSAAALALCWRAQLGRFSLFVLAGTSRPAGASYAPDHRRARPPFLDKQETTMTTRIKRFARALAAACLKPERPRPSRRPSRHPSRRPGRRSTARSLVPENFLVRYGGGSIADILAAGLYPGRGSPWGRIVKAPARPSRLRIR